VEQRVVSKRGRRTTMPTRSAVEDFLAQQHLAFVGVSRERKQFANTVYRHLRSGGRTLYPVNVAAEGSPIEGDPSYPRLADVPNPVEGVVVMVPAHGAAAVVRDAIDRRIPRVWLHRGGGPGSVSEEAVQLCRDAGVVVVDGACPLMFDKPVRGVHWVHSAFAGRRIAAR
jgi:predicted CoA-binding protein